MIDFKGYTPSNDKQWKERWVDGTRKHPIGARWLKWMARRRRAK